MTTPGGNREQQDEVPLIGFYQATNLSGSFNTASAIKSSGASSSILTILILNPSPPALPYYPIRVATIAFLCIHLLYYVGELYKAAV